MKFRYVIICVVREVVHLGRRDLTEEGISKETSHLSNDLYDSYNDV